jgi:hypothetical protein
MFKKLQLESKTIDWSQTAYNTYTDIDVLFTVLENPIQLAEFRKGLAENMTLSLVCFANTNDDVLDHNNMMKRAVHFLGAQHVFEIFCWPRGNKRPPKIGVLSWEYENDDLVSPGDDVADLVAITNRLRNVNYVLSTSPRVMVKRRAKHEEVLQAKLAAAKEKREARGRPPTRPRRGRSPPPSKSPSPSPRARGRSPPPTVAPRVSPSHNAPPSPQHSNPVFELPSPVPTHEINIAVIRITTTYPNFEKDITPILEKQSGLKVMIKTFDAESYEGAELGHFGFAIVLVFAITGRIEDNRVNEIVGSLEVAGIPMAIVILKFGEGSTSTTFVVPGKAIPSFNIVYISTGIVIEHVLTRKALDAITTTIKRPPRSNAIPTVVPVVPITNTVPDAPQIKHNPVPGDGLPSKAPSSPRAPSAPHTSSSPAPGPSPTAPRPSPRVIFVLDSKDDAPLVDELINTGRMPDYETLTVQELFEYWKAGRTLRDHEFVCRVYGLYGGVPDTIFDDIVSTFDVLKKNTKCFFVLFSEDNNVVSDASKKLGALSTITNSLGTTFNRMLEWRIQGMKQTDPKKAIDGILSVVNNLKSLQ